MFGEDMGTLTVFARTAVGGYMPVLFTKTGHSNDYWELADADVPVDGSQNFQVNSLPPTLLSYPPPPQIHVNE